MENLLFVLLNSNRISNEKLVEVLVWFMVAMAILVIIWCLNYFFKKILDVEDKK